MKKLIKDKIHVPGGKLILTVDERLSKLDLKSLAPEKLAEANKHLNKMRSLPK
jgi:hypothetical protein